MEPEMSKAARYQVLAWIQDVMRSWVKNPQTFVVATPSSF